MDLRDAFALTEHLLEIHGLDEWTPAFDSAKRRAGVCRFGPKVLGLSAPLTMLHDEEEVRDTILHEIAHALVGPRHGHDHTWRKVAQSIGCSGMRCVSEDAPRLQTAWLGICPAGHSIGRHRRPERVASCRECSSSFDLSHLLTWTFHGTPARMHPNYEAELAQLRAGTRTRLLQPGQRARVAVDGEFHGLIGFVVKRGRTRYQLRTARGILSVPFAWVEQVA